MSTKTPKRVLQLLLVLAAVAIPEASADFCSDARAAAARCWSNYLACGGFQVPGCWETYSACRLASGIDQCE